MSVHLIKNGAIVASSENAILKMLADDTDVQHPRAIFKLWSDADLKRLGVYREVAEVSGTPGEFTTSSESVVYDSGNDRVVRTTTHTDLPVATIRDRLKDRVDTIRAEKLRAGANVTVANTTFTVQTRSEQDMINIQAIASSALVAITTGNANTVIQFRDANNVTHNLVATDAISMATQTLAKLSAVYAKSWELKDSFGSLSKAQLKALDITADWPELP